MFDIQVDRIRAMVTFALRDRVDGDQMDAFSDALKAALQSLQGRDIKLLCDLRSSRPMAQDVAEKVRSLQRYALDLGVKRMAEIIESDIVALQRQRVARESGTEKILRRFLDAEEARAWLLHGELASSAEGPQAAPRPGAPRDRSPASSKPGSGRRPR